jgi:hypothetical protein
MGFAEEDDPLLVVEARISTSPFLWNASTEEKTLQAS